MSEQLNQAYSLIKEGQNQAAIAILEPLIRSDRDNEDAWWLLANATSDPAAKRNAVNNVLRLSTNETRKTKAQAILQQLSDDPFDFEIDQAPTMGMSSYQALDDVPRKKSSGFSCATISLILVGIIGLCACAGVFALGSAAGGIFRALSYPTTFTDKGILEGNVETTGALAEDAPRDAYFYTGASGDILVLTVDYDSTGSPLVVIFDSTTQVPVAFAQPETSGAVSLSFELPNAGEYIISVNGFKFLGQEFGLGDYTLDFEVR